MCRWPSPGGGVSSSPATAWMVRGGFGEVLVFLAMVVLKASSRCTAGRIIAVRPARDAVSIAFGWSVRCVSCRHRHNLHDRHRSPLPEGDGVGKPPQSDGVRSYAAIGFRRRRRCRPPRQKPRGLPLGDAKSLRNPFQSTNQRHAPHLDPRQAKPRRREDGKSGKTFRIL